MRNPGFTFEQTEALAVRVNDREEPVESPGMYAQRLQQLLPGSGGTYLGGTESLRGSGRLPRPRGKLIFSAGKLTKPPGEPLSVKMM
jgi:hypothetical protein